MSSSVTCHLSRQDGSRWIVTAYTRDAEGVTVCAVRELDAHAANGVSGARTDDARNSLWRTRLEEGDRLEWRAADGRVLASSRARVR